MTALGRMIIKQAIWYITTRYTGVEKDGVMVGKTKLVYGDTDSCLIKVEGIETDKLWPMGEGMSKATTHYLKTWWLKIDEEHSLVNPTRR